jgi:hypothetical protein
LVCDFAVTKLHDINRAVLPLRADLLVAGAHCALATNSEPLVNALSGWICAGVPRSRRTFDLEVLVGPELPHTTEFKTQTHFRGVHHLVFATIGSHEVFAFDLARRRVTGAVSALTAQDRNFWVSHWLPITIGIMGTTIGVIPLHCACLDRDGRGLLLAGVSGAGKSTLSVALARCGLSLISDDWTYITRERYADSDSTGIGALNRLIAHGLSAPVKLLPDAINHFPELANHTPKMWFNGELAFELSAGEVAHTPVKTISQPQWLFFLERTSATGCDFHRVTATEVREFFESSAERLPACLPATTAARSLTIEALSDCRSWRVRSGESPAATAQALADFCESN